MFVSVQEDSDEENDNSEKEEEWIEFIKSCTKDAEEHLKNAGTLLDRDTQKDEVEYDKKGQVRSLIGILVRTTKSEQEDQRKDGKTTSTTL